MPIPNFSMRQLLEAGVHFGHQTHLWDPKMAAYIYGARNRVHIIDLSLTVPLLRSALEAVSNVAARGGRVLFVGTTRQASRLIAKAAQDSAQYYINSRWFGGTLTNWNTIAKSIDRLKELEVLLEGEKAASYTKKERLSLEREHGKLERALGGIKDMGGRPDILFIVDINKEAIALSEAKRLGIPVAAVVDTNCDPTTVDYPIPGNDDASRSISFYCDLVAKAVIDGLARSSAANPVVDPGAASVPPIEDLPAEEPVATRGAADASDSVEPQEVAVDEPADETSVVAQDQDDAPVDALPEVQAAQEDEQTRQEPAPEEPTAQEDEPARQEPVPPETAPEETATKEPEPAGTALHDDLTKINGIGPVLAKKLQEQGVMTFAAVATLEPEQIEALDEKINISSRLERDGWIAQARKLVAEAG